MYHPPKFRRVCVRSITAAIQGDARVLHILRNLQDSLSRAQREGLRPGDCNTGHGRTQVGRILSYEEALCV